MKPLLILLTIYSTVRTDDEMKSNILRAPGQEQVTATQTPTTSQVEDSDDAN